MNLLELIKKRRAVYPDSYVQGEPLDKDVVEQLLEAANWAPTHKLSQPWRFYIFHDSTARHMLGQRLAEAYKTGTKNEDFSELKYQKFLSRVNQSACVMVLGMRPDPSLPEWEEIAAVASAVQNMWLMCADLGLGSYWSTPSFFLSSAASWLPMTQEEKCLGLFYIGYTDKEWPPTKRKPWVNISTWM